MDDEEKKLVKTKLIKILESFKVKDVLLVPRFKNK
jgi:hypothetical protein